MSRARTISLKVRGDTADALDALAKRFGVDREEMFERLVFGSAQHTSTEGDSDAASSA